MPAHSCQVRTARRPRYSASCLVLAVVVIAALQIKKRWEFNRKKVCFIVPVRNRDLQEDVFATFLRGKMVTEGADYALVFSRQTEGRKFNRGLLLNVGFQFINEKFNCRSVYLHDVDMLVESPLSYGTLLGKRVVRHLASRASQFNYSQPYKDYLSGIVGMRPDFFSLVDGFSIDFWGWGAEDDEFRDRIIRQGAYIERPREGRVLSLTDGHTTRDKSEKIRNRAKYAEIHYTQKFRGLFAIRTMSVLGNQSEVMQLGKNIWAIEVRPKY